MREITSILSCSLTTKELNLICNCSIRMNALRPVAGLQAEETQTELPRARRYLACILAQRLES